MHTRFWNFTWDTNVTQKKLPDIQKLINFFNREATEAVFQLEKGSVKKKIHIQGTFILDSKRTSKTDVLIRFAGTFQNVSGLTLSPTYSSVDSSAYCKKTEGRVSGPYFCGKNEKYDSEYASMELTNWQKILFENLCSDETQILRGRNVITIHDSLGKSGKSSFVRWLRTGQKTFVARKLPVASVQQLNSAVYLLTKTTQVDLFLIDITRSMGKDQTLKDLFCALEDVINGFVVDVMYGRYHETLFKPPLVMIFTNYGFEELYPHMSDDRWIPLQIGPNKDLSHIIHEGGKIQNYTPFQKLTLTKK